MLRSIMIGDRRYGELLEMPERISTNILADRLQMLEAEGLISKQAYQQRPTRFEYRLTEKGADLLPAVQAFIDWSNKHIPGRMQLPEGYRTARPEQFYPDKD